ncbi:MAG: hypothetical protein QNL04_03045 [SAR324 cluster bacterium]|nr:hypothetical protein [SAR324 cluster bacterium]
MKKIAFLLLVSLALTSNLWAQDDAFGDFDLGTGSDDTSLDISDVDTSTTKASGHQFYGFFKEEVGYAPNRDEFQIAKIKTTVNLTYDIKFDGDWKTKMNVAGFYDAAYGYNGSENYTTELIDSLESEFEAKDFYLEGPLADWLHIRAGRQVVAWGQSEAAQINDLVNPRDNRELGMVDLEDARLPVTATKLVATSGTWEFNLVAMHEFRANKRPAEGSEFDFYAALRDQGAVILESETPESVEQEYLLRVYKSYNGGNFSVFYGDVYTDNPTLAFYSYNAATSTMTLKPTYEKIKSIGVSGNQVWGSWLLRVEAAKKSGVPQMRSDSATQLQTGIASVATPSDYIYTADLGLVESYSKKDLLQFALGLEYSGITDLSISLEGAVDQIQDYETNLQAEEVSGVTTMMVSHSALNDNLTTRVLWFHFTGSNGEVVRLTTDYNILDGVSIGGGAVEYSATETDALLYPFKDNDRVFINGKYSF